MKSLFTRAARESLGPALLAASVGTVAMFVVRYLFLIPTPPELYGDRATVLIPVNLFSALLQTFGSNTKHIFFVALVVGAALLAVVFGVIYWAARLWATSRNADIASRLGASPGWLDALLVWTLLFALTAGVVAPLLGGGFLGAQLQTGIGGALLSLLTPVTAFTASFIPLMRRNLETQSEGNEEAGATEGRISRRRLIGQGAFAAAVVAGGIVAWQFITSGLGASIGLRTPSSRPAGLNFANTPKRIVPPPTPEYGAWTRWMARRQR